MTLVPYVFTQTINYPSYLQTKIQGLGLASIIDHIDTDASTTPMSLTLWFQSSLSTTDESTLDNYMASYTDPTVTQTAINDCITALNTDENVIIVARERIVNMIPTMDTVTLIQLCNLLGVNPNS